MDWVGRPILTEEKNKKGMGQNGKQKYQMLAFPEKLVIALNASIQRNKCSAYPNPRKRIREKQEVKRKTSTKMNIHKD